MSTAVDDYNAVIGNLNLSQQKLAVYLMDWASLPAAVKAAIKANVIATIDQSVIDLAAVKVRVQNS